MQYKDNQACQGRNLAQVMLQARAEDEVGKHSRRTYRSKHGALN